MIFMHDTGTVAHRASPDCWLSCFSLAPVYSSAALGWEHLQVYRFNNLHCWDLRLPPIDWHFISAHLLRPCNVAARWSGQPWRGRSVPGNAMLMNAGHDSVWHCAEPIDELHIFLHPCIVAEVAEEAGSPGLRLIDGVGLVDPALREIAAQLLFELENPGMATRLFADTMARALALQLIRRHSTARVPDSERRVEMTSRQLRAATDYIDSHIDQELTLESISTAIAMSPFRFARGFRKAAGHSPRQYIILRRIERAKELLRNSDRDLAEIASLVGFSTQSHFTAMFRRQCGTTPKRYRG